MKSKPRILIECENLMLASGSGIATYAQNLISGLGSLGYAVAGLASVRRLPREQDNSLNEMALFDASRVAIGNAHDLLSLVLRHTFCDPLGLTPRQVKAGRLIIPPLRGFPQSLLEQMYITVALSGRAYAHFQRYGRVLELKGLEGIDVFQTTQMLPLRARDKPSLCTVHDIIPIKLPHATLSNKTYWFKACRSLLNAADHIVTVSEHSKKDIISAFGITEDKITNTYQAVEMPSEILEASSEDIARDLRNAYGLDFGSYFLFVGTIEPKKNVGRMIDAYAMSGVEAPLILAGAQGWQYQNDMRKIHDRRFSELHLKDGRIRKTRRVRHMRYVPRADLLKLIRGARALVFPSLYEGFGLPVLEAMALGTPVITSNSSSLPEIAGEAALMVDPYDTDALARAFRTIDQDHDLRRDLARRGPMQAAKFSPAAYRERLDALYARYN